SRNGTETSVAKYRSHGVQTGQDGRPIADQGSNTGIGHSTWYNERESKRIQCGNYRVVLGDQAHRALRDIDRLYYLPEVLVHQNHVCDLASNVGAVFHGDSHIRIAQSHRVIYSVADHCDRPAFLLQLLNYFSLFGRQYLRKILIEAKLSGYGACDG